MIIAVPVDLADATLTAEMADDLAAVEAALRDTSFGGDEMFAEVSRHMMPAGGKRFRAMLVLLAARFGDCRDKRIVPAAVAIELTHLATLFHDDVMDEAAIQRGQPSANSRFGNSIAILAGTTCSPGRPASWPTSARRRSGSRRRRSAAWSTASCSRPWASGRARTSWTTTCT